MAVTVGGTTTNVAAGEALAHGGSIAQLCENVNSVYTGTITIACALGAVSLGAGSCEAAKDSLLSRSIAFGMLFALAKYSKTVQNTHSL